MTGEEMKQAILAIVSRQEGYYCERANDTVASLEGRDLFKAMQDAAAYIKEKIEELQP